MPGFTHVNQVAATTEPAHSPVVPDAHGVAPPGMRAPGAASGPRAVAGRRQRPSRVPAEPSLRVGPAAARAEREADEVAGELARPSATGGHRAAGASIRPGDDAATATDADPVVTDLVHGALGQGQPLPGSLRQRYGQRLGSDLGAVRVHTDSRADAVNLLLGSSAATVGNDVFFRHGAYDPARRAGRELLMHELVHTQQPADGGGPLIRRGTKRGRSVVEEDSDSEDEDFEPEDEGFEPEDEEDADDGLDDADEEDGGSMDVHDVDPGTDAEEGISAMDEEGASEGERGTPEPAHASFPAALKDMSRADMEKYLKESAGLKKGAPVKRVTMGVVVWNVNHFGADKLTKGKKKPAGQDPIAADIKNALKADYNADLMEKAMKRLKPILAKVGGTLNKAADEAIADLDEEADAERDAAKVAKAKVDERTEQLKNAKNKPKKGDKGTKDWRLAAAQATVRDIKLRRDKISAARAELSQLKTDLELLQALNFKEEVRPGIDAMVTWKQEHGKRSRQLDPDQLDRLRRFYRVWKRLARLRTYLLGNRVTEEHKTRAREQVRDALDGKQLELIGKQLNAMFTKGGIALTRPQAAITGLKRDNVIDLTTRTFFADGAVSLVLINEMNQGIGLLSAAVDRQKGKLGLSVGPHMRANSAGKGTQHEYYPAVHRSDDLTSARTFYVTTAGTFTVQADGKNQDVSWSKKTSDYRGIVVHRYIKDGQEFWAAVLHTTPYGSGLDRRGIWPEIRDAITQLSELAKYFHIPLLVAGDFYISAESIVEKPTADEMTDLDSAHPKYIGQTKLWNIARAIFLAAAKEEDSGKNKPTLTTLMRKVDGHLKRRKPARPTKRPKTGVPENILHVEEWYRYESFAADKIAKIEAKRSPSYEQAIKELALGVNVKVDWKTTLAGGRIKEQDIVRNLGSSIHTDPESDAPAFTMQDALKKLKLRIVDAGNPTNPKDKGLDENKEQIADIFVVNQYWRTAQTGIVRPDSGKLKPVDDEKQTATKRYWKISDHSPVLLLASTDENDAEVSAYFDPPSPAAWQQVVKANQGSWGNLVQRLATEKLTAKGMSLSKRAAVINEMLGTALLGPDDEELAKLRKQIALLHASVKKPKPTDKQEAVLAELAGWTPYYVINVDDQPQVTGGPGAARPVTQTGAAAVATKPDPKSKPASKPKPAEKPKPATKPDKEEVSDSEEEEPLRMNQGQAAQWPTGQIEHAENSCYLAALIHVFASDQHLRDLLDDKRQGISLAAKQFLKDSALKKLVDKLQDPRATISEGEMTNFMSYLARLGNVLIGPDAVKPGVRKQAARKAKAVIAADAAAGFQEDASEVLRYVLNQLDQPASMRLIVESTTDAPDSVPKRTPETGLELGIGEAGSIAEAVDREFTSEDVEVNDGGTRTARLASLPNVLIITLKRLTYDGDALLYRKIDKPVKADKTLTIRKRWLTQDLQRSVVGQNVTYKLVHVVHQSADATRGTAIGGHFTSYGMLPGRNDWYQHNDIPEGGRRRHLPTPTEASKALNTGYIYIYVKNPVAPPRIV